MADYMREVLSFCEGFAEAFPGYSCKHVLGAGFDRNCQGLTVFKDNHRIGTLLLTDNILEDVTVAEILARLKKVRILESLQKDKPIVFGNAGMLL